VNISIGYFVEQSLVIIIAVASMILSIFQIRAHSVWREQCKALHRNLHPTIFAGSILALVWAIDPRGLYGIYPWYVLGFIKDQMIVLLYFGGSVWLTQVVKVLFEVNNKSPPKGLRKVLSIYPSLLLWVTIMICDSFRVAGNVVWPSAFMLWMIAILTSSSTFAVVWCIHIVHQTNKAVSAKVKDTQQAARSKVMRKLCAGAGVYLGISIYEIIWGYYTFIWVGTEDANQVPDPERFTMWNITLVWFVVDAAVFYLSWLPILRVPEPVLASPPSDGPKIPRGSKFQRGPSVDRRQTTTPPPLPSTDPTLNQTGSSEQVLSKALSSDKERPDRPSMEVTAITPIREASGENLNPI